ncbi:aspartyl-phosphate phosphatase Spo0E family protein [Evansella sp. AB-rgal1]|uniref:aspartyl-phosphate phosphatase Spo0E family protein n=1 Tax=Evansella sp. AB-rgal1 TaxID=3242696 RepID=UPI00359D5AAD
MDPLYVLKLLNQIKIKKDEMYVMAQKYGLNDERVVVCSQDLDSLLNKYQGIDEAYRNRGKEVS